MQIIKSACDKFLSCSDDGNKLTEPNTTVTGLLSSLLPSNDESPMDTTANTTPQMSTRETATISETAETVDDAGIETAQQEATSVVSTSDGTVQPTQSAEEGGDNTKDKWVIT